MKKITLLLLLVLSPIVIFSQTQTENYIKTTTSLSQFNGTFTNDSKNLTTADIIYTTSGSLNGPSYISVSNNVLTVMFSGSWSQQTLKLGTIKTLNITPALTKLELGPIVTSGGIQTGYFAKIENNNLIFYSPFFLTGLGTNISASIAGGAPGVNYSVATGYPFNCTLGGGGGTIYIKNGVANLVLSAGWSNTCNLRTGQIVQLTTSVIPNTELGIIKDQNGLDTAYRAKIENNWLVFYSGQTIPVLPSSGKLSFSLNLLGTAQDRLENITYFDGLGRPKQQVASTHSFSGKDIVTPIEYDGYGRQALEYLPYTSQSTNLNYKTTAKADLLSYYSNPTLALTGNPTFEATGNPYSKKKFDDSPLNRVIQQAAPGNDWVMGGGNEIKLDYLANTDADNVKLYGVTTSLISAADPVFNTSLVQTINYPKNVLYKTVTKNENWKATQTYLADNTTEEFKDKSGKVVLKRTYNLNAPFDTYYVYDDYGNLTYVLPPKAVDMINPASLQTTISSSAVVPSGSSLSLAATSSITLTTGFHAQAGSTFTASIINNGNDNQTILNELCYQYKYDYRNRLVQKKLPGKDWEYIVYDKLDRPVLTQDGNLRRTNKWMFTKYDAFNRPVYTGEYVNTAQVTRPLVQDLANGAAILFESRQANNAINGSAVSYSNNSFPKGTDVNTSIDLFAINYYDDYSFELNGGYNQTSYGVASTWKTKGLATGSKIRILGTTAWTTNVIYYDVKGRPIYNYSKNDYLGTTADVKSQLDFIGKTLETISTHTRAGITTAIIDIFVYDKVGRLLTQKQKINAQEEIIAENTYDELGQLIKKGVGGKATQNRLQAIDLSYNVRGWLKNINNIDAIGADLFAFRINYNDISDNSKKLYNGNISQTLWKTANDPLANVPRNYVYTYDALNRLTDATDNYAPTLNRYNESAKYDKNGNITSILRKGHTDANVTNFGTMDDLTYTYDAGNKLLQVEDSSGSSEGFNNGTSGTLTDYGYDPNGNMTKDFNKGIGNSTTDGITYNYLNLPTEVKFNNDSNNKITYIYDAVGTKQKKILTQNGVITETTYAGGFIYEKRGVAGVDELKFFSQPEGYVELNGSAYKYVYQYKDHLGNIRLSYKDVSSTNTPLLQIEEENNYYPFGLKQKGYNGGTLSTNIALRNKFNGKEYQDENIGGSQLNVTKMDFRMYDNALGRFNSIDALSELNYSTSPFTFAYNNPVFWADPSGLLSQSFINSIWNNSSNGTKWVNDGSGNFDKIGSNGFVNTEGEYHEGAGKGEILPNVTIIRGIGDKRNGDRIRGNAYLNGKYYQHWRDGQSSKKADEFQSGLDWAGTIPVLGEIFDGINAGVSTLRGNYGQAGLSLAAMIPFAGWAATGLKQSHHVIPKAVYNEFASDLAGIIKKNGAANLMDLPVPFHLGGHKAYSDYVRMELNSLRKEGLISTGSIEALQLQMRGMINEGLENFSKTGDNLNTYFKQL